MANPISTKDFIMKAVEVHGRQYSYSKTNYVGNNIPIIITCHEHGDFTQKPSYHIRRKSGCVKCYRDIRSYDVVKFLELSEKYPTGQFIYGEYLGFRQPMSITCDKHHHTFMTTPILHLLTAGGCKYCLTENASITDADWMMRFNESYPNYYDYSKINTKIRSDDKICVVCPILGHGEFFPHAGAHAKGLHGCPTCASLRYPGGYSKEHFELHPETKQTIGTLYLIKVIPEDSRSFIKVGITIGTVFDRFRYKMPYEYEIIKVKSGMIYDLYLDEQAILISQKHYQYIPKIRFPGWTECFRSEISDDIVRLLCN
jgi:hypothetical protein